MRGPFDREGFGQSDDGPLRRRIGAAAGHAQPPGGRGQVHDRGAAALAQQGQGMLDAEELTMDVDVEGCLPRRGVERFQGPSGPGDAGVVDQDVEAAHFDPDGVHEFADLALVRDVADRGEEPVDAGLVDGVGVDVGDEDGGAEFPELAGDGQADAVGSGGDENAFGGEIHE